jgi:hypothetical protein
MAAIFAFKCSCCAEVHEGAPSFGFDAPMYYSELTEAERAAKAKLGSDLCTIDHEEGTDYFARVCLEVPIHGHEDPFLWGIWVSLSEQSFQRYRDTWDEPVESDAYFGWFSNRLPVYPDTVNLKTRVRPRGDGMRAALELEECDHPLSVDVHQGISVARAQEIAEQVMHAGAD